MLNCTQKNSSYGMMFAWLAPQKESAQVLTAHFSLDSLGEGNKSIVSQFFSTNSSIINKLLNSHIEFDAACLRSNKDSGSTLELSFSKEYTSQELIHFENTLNSFSNQYDPNITIKVTNRGVTLTSPASSEITSLSSDQQKEVISINQQSSLSPRI